MRLFNLYIIEGAFNITDSMYDYAHAVANKAQEIQNNPEEYKLDIPTKRANVAAIRGVVDAGKFGSKEIETRFFVDPQNKVAGTALASNEHRNKNGQLYLMSIKIPNNELDYYDTIDGAIHELVHLFDPKLNKQDVYNKLYNKYAIKDKPKDKRDTEWLKRYIKMPWEVDAFMTTKADEIIRLLYQEHNHKEGVKIAIRNFDEETVSMLPEHIRIPLLAFRDRKSLWAKFKKALYKRYNYYFNRSSV